MKRLAGTIGTRTHLLPLLSPREIGKFPRPLFGNPAISLRNGDPWFCAPASRRVCLSRRATKEVRLRNYSNDLNKRSCQGFCKKRNKGQQISCLGAPKLRCLRLELGRVTSIHRAAERRSSRKPEEVYSETRFPVYGILGNSISSTTHSRKPYM